MFQNNFTLRFKLVHIFFFFFPSEFVFLLVGILKWRYLIGARNIRWTLGADNICFTKYWHTIFFSLGRVVPVCRGEGVYQRSMDFVLEQLNCGQWLHMFPEGFTNLQFSFLIFYIFHFIFVNLLANMKHNLFSSQDKNIKFSLKKY